MEVLDPSKQYFTVSQEHGPSLALMGGKLDEFTPPNLKIFCGNGFGEYPIPMVNPGAADAPPLREKTHLAVFRGKVDHTDSLMTNFGHPSVRRMLVEKVQDDDCIVSGRSIGMVDHLQEIAESYFSFTPVSSGRNTFRFYESLKFGVIPVYVYFDHPWLPWIDKIHWEDVCVVCHYSELDTIAQKLRDISLERREEMRLNVVRVYKEYFSNYDAIANLICEVLTEGTLEGFSYSDHWEKLKCVI